MKDVDRQEHPLKGFSVLMDKSTVLVIPQISSGVGFGIFRGVSTACR